MRYVGSKNRIAKDIVPILQKLIDDNNIRIYYEPFVGGCNMIDKIKCEHRVGNDIHKELIAMWIALQNGWKPPEFISEEEYNKVRINRKDYPDYYVGYVGFHATFGSKYFAGYARGFKADGKTPRIQNKETYDNTMKQIPNIQGIKFINKNYLDIDMRKLRGALIYCDIPYRNSTKYSVEHFDYERYYDWCREVSEKNILVCSEYNMPSDFKCIWKKSVKTSLKIEKQEERTEKLFMLNPKKYGLKPIESETITDIL